MGERKPTVPPAHENKTHREHAVDHLAIAAELELKNGPDYRIARELAAAQVHATLAVAEQFAPRYEVIHESQLPEPRQRVMPCAEKHPHGSAGLCMAAYSPRPGAITEYCSFPAGHEHTPGRPIPHSWERAAMDLDPLGPMR